jgi:MraZ protein
MKMAQNPSPAQTASAPPQAIFSGEFRHSLDNKNRITIPSRWRSADTEEFFIVPDPTNQFLVVMPPAEFRRVNEALAQDASITAKKKRVFMRHFYSKAHAIATDRQGRLVLPDDYCKQVGLKNEAVLVGSFSRFELWNPGRWKQSVDASKVVYEEVAESVGL